MTMKGRRITILDTTLRDGDQSPSHAFTVRQKVRIAVLLDDLGVDIIEAGFPASSRTDYDSVAAVSECLCNAAVSALSRTIPSDIEKAARAIERAKKKMIHLSIAASPLHREFKLGMSCTQIIDHARTAVRTAKAYADIVEIGAEDAMRTEPEFLLEFCHAVADAGADVINITDTVGYIQPTECEEIISRLHESVSLIKNGSVRLSVHCHNDAGLAAANTLAALHAGASQIETTLLGLGERAGNTSLEQIYFALTSRSDYYQNISIGIQPEKIAEVARVMQRISGIPVPPSYPVVGRNAFLHGSGIHQDGMLSHQKTYALLPGSVFGYDDFRFVLTRHSGCRGFSYVLENIFGVHLSDEKIKALTALFKDNPCFDAIITATDIAAFLNDHGIISSTIWRVKELRHIRSEDHSCGMSISCASSSGQSVILRLMYPFSPAQLFKSMNALFEMSVFIEEYSYTACGNHEESSGRFFLHARVGEKKYYSERSGIEPMHLAAEAFLDIINTIQCFNRS
jgi:2-isopropylmalate synthase